MKITFVFAFVAVLALTAQAAQERQLLSNRLGGERRLGFASSLNKYMKSTNDAIKEATKATNDALSKAGVSTTSLTNSLTNSMNNFKEQFGSMNDALKEFGNKFAESYAKVGNDFSKWSSDMKEDVSKKFQSVTDSLSANAKKYANQINDSLEKASASSKLAFELYLTPSLEALGTKADAFTQKAQNFIDVQGEKVQVQFQDTYEAMKDLADESSDKVKQAYKGLVEMSSDKVSAVKEAAKSAKDQMNVWKQQGSSKWNEYKGVMKNSLSAVMDEAVEHSQSFKKKLEATKDQAAPKFDELMENLGSTAQYVDWETISEKITEGTSDAKATMEEVGNIIKSNLQSVSNDDNASAEDKQAAASLEADFDAKIQLALAPPPSTANGVNRVSTGYTLVTVSLAFAAML